MAYSSFAAFLTALERAFQLARSGRIARIGEIRETLKAEGYPDQQLVGRTLSRQLTALIVAARVAEAQGT